MASHRKKNYPKPTYVGRIKIIKCSLRFGWYKNQINQEFEVGNLIGDEDFALMDDYTPKRKTVRRTVKACDCELLQTI